MIDWGTFLAIMALGAVMDVVARDYPHHVRPWGVLALVLLLAGLFAWAVVDRRRHRPRP